MGKAMNHCTMCEKIKDDVTIAYLCRQCRGNIRKLNLQKNRIKWFEEFYERIENDSPDVVSQILKDMGNKF